jgi:hypothetical protein
MEILLLLFLWIVVAAYTSQVAASKGYSAGAWALGGFLFGPLALLASLGLPDLILRRYIRLLAEHKGIVVEESSIPNTPGGVDADEQRRRILGGK